MLRSDGQGGHGREAAREGGRAEAAVGGSDGCGGGGDGGHGEGGGGGFVGMAKGRWEEGSQAR